MKAELDGGNPDQPLVHPNLAKIYRQKVERLGNALRDQKHGREAFELVRSLIREVRLPPTGDALSLELKGDLAGILAISDTAKPHQDAEARALQIKVVAGMRSHLYRTAVLLPRR